MKDSLINCIIVQLCTKQNYWKNKNNGVKYSKSYKPMVKIIGDGSTPRELATFQSFPEDFIFVEVRNGSLLK